MLGAVVPLVGLGPIAVAVLMLRCCDDARGPTAGAWVVVGVVLVAIAGVGAVAGGLLAAGVRRVVRGRHE